MNVGKLTKNELKILKEMSKRFNLPITVDGVRSELLGKGYAVPSGHYFDQKLIASGCILADGVKGVRVITGLPKEVL